MGALWFDCRKRPPPVGDHLILAFWVVAYGRFDCITYVAGNSKQDEIKRTPDLTLYTEIPRYSSVVSRNEW